VAYDLERVFCFAGTLPVIFRLATPARTLATTERNAAVGGFLARKGDGEPGVKTIWLGLKDVHVAVKTMRAQRRLGGQATCV
jgi:hypothetical protein